MPRRGRGWVILIGFFVLTALGYRSSISPTQKPNKNIIKINGVGQAQELFGGVRQEGARLGSEDAPVTVQVFADEQSSNCREGFLSTIPPLTEKYVRPGKVKFLYRHYSNSENPIEYGFYGTEAAAEQGYGWEYAYLFFVNQNEADRFGVSEAENRRAGLRENFLESVAGGVEELEAEEWEKAFEEGQEPGSAMQTQPQSPAGTRLEAGHPLRHRDGDRGPRRQRNPARKPDPRRSRSRDRTRSNSRRGRTRRVRRRRLAAGGGSMGGRTRAGVALLVVGVIGSAVALAPVGAAAAGGETPMTVSVSEGLPLCSASGSRRSGCRLAGPPPLKLRVTEETDGRAPASGIAIASTTSASTGRSRSNRSASRSATRVRASRSTPPGRIDCDRRRSVTGEAVVELSLPGKATTMLALSGEVYDGGPHGRSACWSNCRSRPR